MEKNNDMLIDKALLAALTLIMILLLTLTILLVNQSGIQGGV